MAGRQRIKGQIVTRRKIKYLAILLVAAIFALRIGRLSYPGAPEESSSVVRLRMPAQDWALLQFSAFRKSYSDKTTPCAIQWGGEPERNCKFSLRGGRALDSGFSWFKVSRLNYSIETKKKEKPFGMPKHDHSYLVNLATDPHFFEIEFCNQVLRKLGLFPSFSKLVALEVNTRTVGPALLMERPQDAIRRVAPGTALIVQQRGLSNTPEYVEKYRSKKKSRKKNARKILKHFVDSLSLPGAKLAPGLDWDAYIRLLTFNTLVKKADSFVDVYYAVDDSGLIRPYATDYGDTMAEVPAHPDYVLKEPFFFGAEGTLNARLASEPQYRSRYLNTAYSLLRNELSLKTLLGILDTLEGQGQDIVAKSSVLEERGRAIQLYKEKLKKRHAEFLATLRDSGIKEF